MSTYIPYTYLIGWSILDRWYYGVRYAKNCHPQEFWKNYYTSSLVVDEFRDRHGEPDIVEIRKTFTNAKDAISWEYNVLKKMNIVNNDRWLNIWIGSGSDHMFGGSVQSKLAKRRIANGTHNLSEWLEKVECPHCKKLGQKRAMKRWHFDNCGTTQIRSKSHSDNISKSLKMAWKDPNKFQKRKS
jgi:hypothetical protein